MHVLTIYLISWQLTTWYDHLPKRVKYSWKSMSGSDISRVLDILKSLYQHVQTLNEFADSVVFREGQKAALIEGSDTARFKSFVGGIFVCTDKHLQQLPSRNEVILYPTYYLVIRATDVIYIYPSRLKERSCFTGHGSQCSSQCE